MLGCAALMKVLLSFEHRLLPANLHFQKPNPKSEGLKEGYVKVTAFAMLPVSMQPSDAGASRHASPVHSKRRKSQKPLSSSLSSWSITNNHV